MDQTQEEDGGIHRLLCIKICNDCFAKSIFFSEAVTTRGASVSNYNLCLTEKTK